MTPDFLPTASTVALRHRAECLRALREVFERSGYWEVETPLLSADVCVDLWLDPVVVPVKGGRRFLQTSPEFAMKRLLVAGADAIYQVTRAFRNEERGGLHNPEFTMVEWYRAGATYHDQMDFTESLAKGIASATVDGVAPKAMPERVPRITYDEAFERAIGRRVLKLNPNELGQLAAELRIPFSSSTPPRDRDGWLNLILGERVDPWLKTQGAIFLLDYPASQSALARVRPDDPPVSERFELYLDGLEICNGYQELTDAEELARRMTHQAALRKAAGLSELPTDSRLLAAMKQGLSECSGVALGFDRLVMWRLGAKSIDEVLAFPDERA